MLVLPKYLFIGRCTDWVRKTLSSVGIKDYGGGIAWLRRARVRPAAFLLESGLRTTTWILGQWLRVRALESDKQDTST